MHTKRRIELIIEKMAHKRACRILEESGMTGYTVLPAMAGAGDSTRWSRDTDISSSGEMVAIISIGDAEKVEISLEKISNLLGAHIGIVSVSDVLVLRPERF